MAHWTGKSKARTMAHQKALNSDRLLVGWSGMLMALQKALHLVLQREYSPETPAACDRSEHTPLDFQQESQIYQPASAGGESPHQES